MSDRRLRIGIAVLLACAVVAVAVVLLGGGGDDAAATAPPVAAAKLVPANALVFVDAATDTARDATKRALAVAERFPGYPALRDSLLAPSVRSWAGDEAALALFAGPKAAQSLVLVEIGDKAAAARYVTEHATGTLVAATAGAFVAIGPAAVVRQAVALAGGATGSRPALADAAAYRRGVAKLPAGRVLTGWATQTGVRRLLAPQSGVLGLLGGLLDRPGLQGVGLAVGPDDAGAAVTAHWLLDPKQAASIQTFTPKLLGRVPADATVVLGSRGITDSLGRLLGLTAGGATDGGLSSLLGDAAQGFAKRSKGDLRAGILGLLDGESVAYLVPGVPRPTLSIVAKTGGQIGTEAALAGLRPAVARLLAQPNAQGTKRVAATWRKRVVDGVTVWTLPFASGSELDYVVADGLLVVSTSIAGIRAALRPGKPIAQTDRWKAVMRNLSNPVGSLVFLDFNQLLRLGEQTGLDESREYQRVRDDLQRIRAVGSTAVPGTGESTAEILLQIP